MTTEELLLPVLPEAIKQVRFDLHLTQAEFAAELGIWPEKVSRMEKGKWEPSTQLLLQIGSMAKEGPPKRAIVEELAFRYRKYPLVKVVA